MRALYLSHSLSLSFASENGIRLVSGLAGEAPSRGRSGELDVKATQVDHYQREVN